MLLTQSYYCSGGNVPLLYETIGAVFDRISSQYADREALVVRDQAVRWSYGEYRDRVDNLATGLLALGIEPGDRVGIWAPNCSEWCLVQFATAKIGAVMVCINPAYRMYELEYALNKVQCKALITAKSFKSSDYLAMLNRLAPELQQDQPGDLHADKLPHLRHIIRLGDGVTEGMWNFDEICTMGTADKSRRMRYLAETLQPDDAINIQFTSGTTGSPKGATLSHFNILNNGKIVGEAMGFSEDDRLCLPVPLYHCFGMVMGNLACITHGAAAVYPGEGFDPLTTLQTVAEERCTALHGVPTMFIAELALAEFDGFDLTSLRTGIMAGAPCPVEVMCDVREKMHMDEVLIAYGQTETSPVNHMTAVDDPLEKRVATVGQPGPHLEIKLIDDEGRLVPVGQKGEICIRGYSVMSGYWDDEEKTLETIDRAGWLHSGDIGIMDKEGYLRIVGRLKDMIIRGGENIYPREIEEFLHTHPAIIDAQVFGVPDDKYGEQVCAWIRLREGQSLTDSDVRDYCKDQIAHFKIPYYIKFVNEYPMTVTGKIQKFRMCEETVNSLGPSGSKSEKKI